MLSLGRDIYDNTAAEKLVLVDRPERIKLFPVSYIAVAGQDGSWKLPFELYLQESLEKPLKTETVHLDLNQQASITEVSTESSSVLGMMRSPTIFTKKISFLLNSVEGVSPDKKSTLELAIDLCLPLRLQNVSAPTDGNVSSTTTSWSPKYRYMDGGYTKCTSVPAAISAMQFCNAKSKNQTDYDCTPSVLWLVHDFFATKLIFFWVCVAPSTKAT